jgi:hypothetical protein
MDFREGEAGEARRQEKMAITLDEGDRPEEDDQRLRLQAGHHDGDDAR